MSIAAKRLHIVADWIQQFRKRAAVEGGRQEGDGEEKINQ